MIEQHQHSRFMDHVREWTQEKHDYYLQRCTERNVHYFDIAYPHLCVICGITENEEGIRHRNGETLRRFQQVGGKLVNVLDGETDEIHGQGPEERTDAGGDGGTNHSERVTASPTRSDVPF